MSLMGFRGCYRPGATPPACPCRGPGLPRRSPARSGAGIFPRAACSRFSPVLSVSPVCRKRVPAAAGLANFQPFIWRQQKYPSCVLGGIISAGLPPSRRFFLCRDAGPLPSPWHGIPTASLAALLWVGWFFPTGHPFMQEVSQGLRIKYIYSIKQINTAPTPGCPRLHLHLPG